MSNILNVVKTTNSKTAVKLSKFFNSHSKVHILLIGATGDGKSTFLDFLSYYEEFSELDAKKLNELKSIFDSSNECYKVGQSMTQNSKNYKINIGKIEFSVLDTPGLGDKREIDQDKENIKNIVDSLKELEFINGICIIANGRVERMTTSFQYIYNELQSIFPKTVLSNIFLIATTCSLKTEVKTPFTILGIPEDRVYCLDNPFPLYSKYLKEKNDGDKKTIFEKLKVNTEQAIFQIDYLFENMGKVESCNTKDILKLYEVKLQIEIKILDSFTATNTASYNYNNLQKALLKKKRS